MTTPAARLAQKIKSCQSWAEVENRIRLCPQLKSEAWELLTPTERAYIKRLKQSPTQSPSSITPSSINEGDLVVVSPSTYTRAGEGVVEDARGYGFLRMLEVRRSDGRLQIVSIAEVRKQSS